MFQQAFHQKKEINIGTNNILPSNQETVEKSAKEENKESFSKPPSTKKMQIQKRENFHNFKKKNRKNYGQTKKRALHRWKA